MHSLALSSLLRSFILFWCAAQAVWSCVLPLQTLQTRRRLRGQPTRYVRSKRPSMTGSLQRRICRGAGWRKLFRAPPLKTCTFTPAGLRGVGHQPGRGRAAEGHQAQGGGDRGQARHQQLDARGGIPGRRLERARLSAGRLLQDAGAPRVSCWLGLAIYHRDSAGGCRRAVQQTGAIAEVCAC